VQSFADAPLTECPTCEGRLRKVFSSVGVVFKGSGFYRTDSRSEATKAAKGTSKTDGGSGGEAKPSSESKSDSGGTKGEAKSDSKAPAAASSP
jgi:predicted nucleic acid-binding Zn ribbon protein